MKLKDKVAVITGAGSGIGRATSFLFSREGATVVCVDIDGQYGNETVSMIRREGGEATFIECDVGDAAAVAKMGERAMALHTRIHVLFNNAGILTRCGFEDMTFEDWQRHLAVNLSGPYLCSRALLPALKAADGASIIHNGTIDAVRGNPTALAYSASKGGLTPLTHIMGYSLGKYKIRVNCINAGAIRLSSEGIPVRLTPDRNGVQTTLSPNKQAATPLGRPGSVEEFARAVLFLATDDSGYFTGSILTMDGGRTAITNGTQN